MNDSIFAEKEFALLIVVSIVLPLALYAVMMLKKPCRAPPCCCTGSSWSSFQAPTSCCCNAWRRWQKSPCPRSTTRYSVRKSRWRCTCCLPLFAGINIISHVIVSHLSDAQREFARQQAQAGAIDAGKAPAP
jgi:hypothetical protein